MDSKPRNDQTTAQPQAADADKLIRFMQERDAKRKKAWTIGGTIAVVTIAVGTLIGFGMKSAADEQRAQDERVQIVTCAINDDC